MSRKNNALSSLDTIIRKLEKWQAKYPEYDKESQVHWAKTQLIRVLNKIED